VISDLVGAVVIIASGNIPDLSTNLIVIEKVLIKLYFLKIQKPYIIIAAAIIGLILKTFVV